jgi:methanogenic corrinoid protein MtbC1
MSEPTIDTDEDLLSIGDVAQAVSLSIDTIRVWERRYGKPVPVRLPSGHRRYTPEQVVWLRRVADALSRGHRPSQVVRMSDEELDELLGPAPVDGRDSTEILTLLEIMTRYDGTEFRARLTDDANRMGPKDFVTKRVSPLMETIGRRWADGELDIRHEHFATGIIEDILRRMRVSIREDPLGPRLVFATLPDEFHGLGLQMIALFATTAGARCTILGTNTPLEEIAQAVEETKARAACVSVSLASAGVATDRKLGELKKTLPPGVDLLVGGKGARGVRRGPRGVRYISDVTDFEDLIAEWRNPD